MVQSRPEVSPAALRWLEAYDCRDADKLFGAAGLDMSEEEAWLFQAEVVRLRQKRGEKRIGYKVGCVSSTIRKQLNLSAPVFGTVWDTEVHDSGSRIFSRNYCHLAIEGEIAFLASDVERSNHTGWECFPVIELHNNAGAAGRVTAPSLIASNAMHAGVIRPARKGRILQAPALDGLPTLQVRINGKLVEEASPSELEGGPFGSVSWLEKRLKASGLAIHPGDIILTGSPGRLIPVFPGDAIKVSWEDLEVSADVLP